jgi:hypothetical protein
MENMDNLISKVDKTLNWLAIIITIAVSGLILLLTYWFFEPDPLSVTRIEGETHWSECTGRRYQFARLVQSSKDIDIYVQERWHDLDGMMDGVGYQGEFVMPKPIHYPLGEDFSKLMTFNKTVPRALPVGRYEYRPWATYKVNPIKTITRMLPMQRVNVHCDYDIAKHGVME